MIMQANHRKDKEKGDPKIGGHPSACASYLHIASSLHLVVKRGYDFMAIKPHAAPMDHTMHFMMDLLVENDFSRFSKEKAKEAMFGLRKFSHNGEPVFQSYHSAYDPDNHNFLPSGTVGIPPVQLGYLAHAYRMAEDHGFETTKDAHFWAVMGDSEYREGSLQEALPDFAERELGNLTWIVDYNRQSLDGNRITNKEIMNGTDDKRIERTALASGWEVIQVRHGKKRLALFAKTGGDVFKDYLENQIDDFSLQSLLVVKDVSLIRKQFLDDNKKLKTFLDNVSDEEIFEGLRDFGGHDFEVLIDALERSKKDTRRPTLIVAHTLKGWGLPQAGASGNHSSLPSLEEMQDLQKAHKIPDSDLFQEFASSTEEAKFLKTRGDELYSDLVAQNNLRDKNKAYFKKVTEELGETPDEIGINLKLVSYPHTQWMLGQLTAKLNRISNTPLDSSELKEKQKPLTETEKAWKLPAEMLVAMAPDVGTSTNLNPTMDGQIYDPEMVEDVETRLNVKDKSLPDLVPSEDKAHKFIRFEIEESNAMSCVGAYGKIRDTLGIPLIPLMTVYDFFVKRALDQHFYNLYWKSSFILVGTPSGVTLSPEGAQHGWKSDFQIPNQITWEPFYCQELDYIIADAIKRHMSFDNEGRNGVNIRAVTRGVEQKDLIKRLQQHAKNKVEAPLLSHADFPVEGATNESEVQARDTAEIMNSFKEAVLAGAYYLIDYRGYAGYEAGDNVVNIFAMGSLTTEAIKASDELLAKGIYANVIVVTSPDLLIGNLAHENNYEYLRKGLEIDTKLHIHPTQIQQDSELVTVAGRRIPAVSVHDGEPGLLDNIGSILGVRHECLAVRHHSKCGRPSEVYAYHGIDHASVVEAVGKALSETALEEIQVHRSTLDNANQSASTVNHWRELWPDQIKN
ncbi:MAG: pyruvate dehydrogenase [Bdellovibrionales bacterium]|nr:pyruvate dehydrogenase [Bdellovibrionales bacterium]